MVLSEIRPLQDLDFEGLQSFQQEASSPHKANDAIARFSRNFGQATRFSAPFLIPTSNLQALFSPNYLQAKCNMSVYNEIHFSELQMASTVPLGILTSCRSAPVRVPCSCI